MNMNSCASWRPVHRYSLCVRVYHPELIAELLSPFQFLCNLIITILSIWYILCVMILFWMPNLSKLSYIIFELLKAVTGWHTKLFVAHDFNWITWKCWIDGTGKDWTETQAWQGKRLKDRKCEKNFRESPIFKRKTLGFTFFNYGPDQLCKVQLCRMVHLL